MKIKQSSAVWIVRNKIFLPTGLSLDKTFFKTIFNRGHMMAHFFLFVCQKKCAVIMVRNRFKECLDQKSNSRCYFPDAVLVLVRGYT